MVLGQENGGELSPAKGPAAQPPYETLENLHQEQPWGSLAGICLSTRWDEAFCLCPCGDTSGPPVEKGWSRQAQSLGGFWPVSLRVPHSLSYINFTIWVPTKISTLLLASPGFI